ncbi:NAD(P)-binding protein [Marasmius fiardii PR-910]|nr:NAD(P)-binding protein [Marasmius fiardii PR-910]
MGPSKRIAVAGGTGGIGSHVVEGLLEIKEKCSLHIIVLSRTSKPDVVYAGASAPIIGVDYHNPDTIEQVFREHDIDTVISTIADRDPSSFITAQQRLLDASLKVPSVRRFAPSEFAIDSEKLKSATFFHAKIPIIESLRKVRESNPDFEFTKFSCGVFMNYFGYGNPKPDGGKAHGHLPRFPYIVDISKGTADVPGDGNRKFCYTSAEDVGRFTAAATQLETWVEDSTMAGDCLTINEVIRMAERITGKTFDVKYNSEDELLARMNPNPENPMTNFYIEVFLGMARGECDQGAELNKLTSVKPTSAEEFLQTWWGN